MKGNRNFSNGVTQLQQKKSFENHARLFLSFYDNLCISLAAKFFSVVNTLETDREFNVDFFLRKNRSLTGEKKNLRIL